MSLCCPSVVSLMSLLSLCCLFYVFDLALVQQCSNHCKMTNLDPGVQVHVFIGHVGERIRFKSCHCNTLMFFEQLIWDVLVFLDASAAFDPSTRTSVLTGPAGWYLRFRFSWFGSDDPGSKLNTRGDQDFTGSAPNLLAFETLNLWFKTHVSIF